MRPPSQTFQQVIRIRDGTPLLNSCGQSINYLVSERPTGDGVGDQIEHEARSLRQLGFVVKRLQIKRRRGGSLVTAFIAVGLGLRLMRRRDLIYARAGITSLIAVVPSVMLGRPTVIVLNGFLRPRGGNTKRPTIALRLLRLCCGRQNVVLVGDRPWVAYAASLGIGAAERRFSLPLWCSPPRCSEEGQSPRRVVTYAGSDQPWQGVDILVQSFLDLRPPDWVLELAGPPSLQRYEDRSGCVRWTGMFDADSVQLGDLLWSSSVLATSYISSRNENLPISALKTIQFLQTDRAVLVSTQDEVINAFKDTSLESLGIFTYDSSTPDSIKAALARAINCADSRSCYDDALRRDLLHVRHSPQAQLTALQRALDYFPSPSQRVVD